MTRLAPPRAWPDRARTLLPVQGDGCIETDIIALSRFSGRPENGDEIFRFPDQGGPDVNLEINISGFSTAAAALSHSLQTQFLAGPRVRGDGYVQFPARLFA